VPPTPKLPLPRWFTIGAAALVVLGLLLVWLTGSDWANGAVRAGIAALVVGAIVLGAFLFRLSQGHRATRTVSLAVASVLLLIILGTAGITLQGPIHAAQANVLEGQQKFASAVSEFKAANDTIGVARTYNDWGEFLLKQGTFSVPDDPTQTATDGALAKFNFVLDQHNGFTKSEDANIQDQVARAKQGLVNTALAWGDTHLNNSDYQGAVDRFKIVLDQKNIYGAVSSFVQLHKEAAKAYLGLGQQLITSGTAAGDCTDAVQTYQILVKDFSDTSQGQQAATDLKKPQSVTGLIIVRSKGTPASGAKLFLSARWQLSGGFFQASDDLSTTSDSSGHFTFQNVTPGDTKYLISYIGTSGGEEITVVGGNQPANVVQVQPLCPTDAGTVAQF
jgi:tetratricopeptide (TPR) repeat protein